MIAGDMGSEYQRAEWLFNKGRYREARELCELIIRIGINSDTDCQFAIETGGAASRLIRNIDELTGYTLNPQSSFYVPEEPGTMQKLMNWIRRIGKESRVRNIVVIVLFSVGAYADESAYPVRWTSHIALESLDQIPPRLAAPLALIGGGSDYLELTRNDDKVRISSGADYVKRIKEGYYPWTRYDRAMARQATDRILPLAMLQLAKPSRVSYLSDFALDQLTLKDLPYDMMVFTEGKPAGFTFHDDCPHAMIEQQTTDLLLWYCLSNPEDPESKLGCRLDIRAWGDFNHDGIEDVLCQFLYDFVYGFERDSYLVVLTRKESGGRITLAGFAENVLRGKQGVNSSSP